MLDANPPVQRAIDDAIAGGREIGVQVAAYHRGRLVVDAWGGLADPASGRPVDGETLFNVYSVTKAVAATAVHMLVDRGRLDYDAPVATLVARVRRAWQRQDHAARRAHASRRHSADAARA